MEKSTLNSKNYINAFLLVGVIFAQNPPWFIWGVYYYILISLVTSLFFFNLNRIIKHPHLYVKKLFIAVVVFYLFFIRSLFETPRMSSFVTVIFFILIFLVNEKEKILALNILTKTLSLIILISLSGWLINTFLFELPIYNTLTYSEGKGAREGTFLNNYIIFIQLPFRSVIRFYSIFDEPGVLGTLSAFVLFANKYDFKNKSNIIILIGGIFTFSLAFIIISLVGYIILNVSKGFKLWKYILTLCIISFIVFLVLKDNETFQIAVIDRLQDFDSSSVDSRTSDYMNTYFKDFILSNDVFFGMGTSFLNEQRSLFQGQGYKFFLIEYGIIGFILVLLMYYSILRKYPKKGYLLLFIYILSFLQRPFLFMPWQIALFSMSIANLEFLDKRSLHESDRIKIQKGGNKT